LEKNRRKRQKSYNIRVGEGMIWNPGKAKLTRMKFHWGNRGSWEERGAKRGRFREEALKRQCAR